MAAELSGLEILETIKEGPVWHEIRARQVPLGRQVRVLVLAHGVLPASPLASGLRRLAQTLGRLDHPAICRLLDFREDEATMALVVEDVLGTTLKDLCDRPLSLDACLALGLSLSRALSHAHGRGVTHGRLSTECVRFDAEGRVKVEGFGAYLTPGEVEPVEPNQAGGLAPETTIGQNPSSMSDLFALGSILYEALCAKPPFGPPDAPGHASRVRNETPESLLRLRPDAPLALRQLVENCLSKLAAERPSDAAQVTASLQAQAGATVDQAIRKELAERGLTALPTKSSSALVETAPRRRYRPGLIEGTILGGLVGAIIAYGASNWEKRKASAPSEELSLATIERTDAMLLRVVATPWAHILVDGRHLQTTPFAEPIVLVPGRHVVRLEHPNAPAEERIVDGQPGQALLLDVRMAIQKPMIPAIEQPTAPEDDSP